MTKQMKKAVSVLMLGVAVSSAAMTVGAQNANAGLLLMDAGYEKHKEGAKNAGLEFMSGVALVLIGGLTSLSVIGEGGAIGLVILSQDGSLSHDSLTTMMMNKYQSQGIDLQTAKDVATLIKKKASVTQPANGKLILTFSKDELSKGLSASNIESDNSVLFDRLVSDLQ